MGAGVVGVIPIAIILIELIGVAWWLVLSVP